MNGSATGNRNAYVGNSNLNYEHKASVGCSYKNKLLLFELRLCGIVAVVQCDKTQDYLKTVVLCQQFYYKHSQICFIVRPYPLLRRRKTDLNLWTGRQLRLG